MGFEIKFEINNEKDLESLKELINLIQNKNEKPKEIILKDEPDEELEEAIKNAKNTKKKKFFDFEQYRLSW